MSKMLFKITAVGAGDPTLDEIKQEYALRDDEVDYDFGVVPIDADQRLYAILVESAAANRINGGDPPGAGPYSNPRIADFGPPQ